MNADPHDLINAYLDETIDAAGMAELSAWLAADPEHARRFADVALLHDRLCDELRVLPSAHDAATSTPDVKEASRAEEGRLVADRARVVHWPLGKRLIRLGGALLTAAACITLVVVLVGRGLGDKPASAAAELNRLIAANAESVDRTYQITVEELALTQAAKLPADAPEWNRPPKPPMTDAVLHVGAGGRFVLIRRLPGGQAKITGSNGRESWSVRSGGAVRVSSDMQQFSRDLPGHEHAMSLVSLDDALRQLRTAYEVQLLPAEAGRGDGAEPTRLLVCVRKPGNRGPNRVEISYGMQTGRILQLRFVEMPYGPERLTLRLTLTEQRPLGEAFFEHAAHHPANQPVEKE